MALTSCATIAVVAHLVVAVLLSTGVAVAADHERPCATQLPATSKYRATRSSPCTDPATQQQPSLGARLANESRPDPHASCVSCPSDWTAACGLCYKVINDTAASYADQRLACTNTGVAGAQLASALSRAGAPTTPALSCSFCDRLINHHKLNPNKQNTHQRWKPLAKLYGLLAWAWPGLEAMQQTLARLSPGRTAPHSHTHSGCTRLRRPQQACQLPAMALPSMLLSTCGCESSAAPSLGRCARLHCLAMPARQQSRVTMPLTPPSVPTSAPTAGRIPVASATRSCSSTAIGMVRIHTHQQQPLCM